jgi:RHS repeat-associated protein
MSSTLYLGGYQYNNNILQFFPHSQGYVKHNINPNTNNSEFDYVYQYKDHLGNIRINYIFDLATSSLKVLEENHYYPFGLKHTEALLKKDIFFEKEDEEWLKKVDLVSELKKGIVVPNSGYQYKYNGKEFQDELGLNMYAMDMRQYDPAIARWVVQDPVTHHSMSPYNAFDNNPVYWADPSGADAVYNWDDGKYYNNGNEVSFEDALASYGLNTNGRKKTTTDAGHGDTTGKWNDPGAVNGDIYEKDMALMVEKEIHNWLSLWGVDNNRTRTGDVDKKGQKKIEWRLKSAKEHGSIVLVSIHLDSGSEEGMFSIYDSNNSESKRLAEIIATNYTHGLNGEGIRPDSRGLRLIKGFSGASVIIELGGILNNSVIDNIKLNHKSIAHDIAMGIYLYLNGERPRANNIKYDIKTQKPILPWEFKTF